MFFKAFSVCVVQKCAFSDCILVTCMCTSGGTLGDSVGDAADVDELPPTGHTPHTASDSSAESVDQQSPHQSKVHTDTWCFKAIIWVTPSGLRIWGICWCKVLLCPLLTKISIFRLEFSKVPTVCVPCLYCLCYLEPNLQWMSINLVSRRYRTNEKG